MTEFTRHGRARMNQRGITKEMIDLAIEYGDYIKDKVILSTKKIKKLLSKVTQEIKSKLLKILDKGGLIVVLGDDCSVITTYNYYK